MQRITQGWIIGVLLVSVLVLVAAKPFDHVTIANFDDLNGLLREAAVEIFGSVTIDGNVDVNLTETTVQAEQLGDWNVGIEGEPTVHLAEAGNVIRMDPGQNTVQVQSSEEDPVVVRVANAETDGRQPFQANFSVTVPDGTPVANFINLEIVPENKFMVIEHVSLRIWAPLDPEITQIDLLTRGGWETCVSQFHSLWAQHIGSSETVDAYLGSHPILAFHDQTCGNMGFSMIRQNVSGSVNVRVTISGYLLSQ